MEHCNELAFDTDTSYCHPPPTQLVNLLCFGLIRTTRCPCVSVHNEHRTRSHMMGQFLVSESDLSSNTQVYI